MAHLLTIGILLFALVGDGHALEADDKYTKCSFYAGGYTEGKPLVQMYENRRTYLPTDPEERNRVQVTINRREANDLLLRCTKIDDASVYTRGRIISNISNRGATGGFPNPVTFSINPPDGLCNFDLGPKYFGPLVTAEELDKFCFSSHTKERRNIRARIPLNVSLGMKDGSHLGACSDHYVEINVQCALCAPLTANNNDGVGTAVVGKEYSHIFYAQSSDTSITYELAPGSSLPGGLLLESRGVMTGVPNMPGTFNASVRALDRCLFGAQDITIPFKLTVQCAPLEISSSELPQAYGGVRYSFNLNSLKHNGQAPVSFKIASGALPEGLGFDESTGIIAGAPKHENTSSWQTLEKTYPLVVRLTDSCALGARSLDKALTLVVTHAPLKLGPTPAGQVEKQRPPTAIPGTPPPVTPKRPPVLKDQSVAPPTSR